jgi:periplasmic mercuric ion binding protein
MKTFLYSLFAITLFWSCNTSNPDTAANAVPVTHKEIRAEVIKTVANISIDGMTCSAGCGGKIQQELRALTGVTATELDYADNRTTNVVSVEYNPSQLTEKDLINCVNAIADGKYQVKGVEIVDYKGLQSAGRGGGADVSTDKFGRVFQLLNLLQSVSKLVQ